MFDQSLINSLSNKYSLPPEEVVALAAGGIEQAASEALGMPLMLRGDGSFVAYGKVIQREELTSQVERFVSYRLETVLAAASEQRKFEAAIKMENTLVWGFPQYRTSKSGDVRMTVELEEEYLGYTGYGALPKKEHGKYKLAGAKAWYVNHVDRNDHRILILNRTSIKLPELLIFKFARQAGIICKVKCLKRVPGAYSQVAVSKTLPERLLADISKELSGEIIKTSTWIERR